MARSAGRYETFVEDRQVYVDLDDDRLRVGDLDAIVGLVGGPAWTISYSAAQRRRHPDLDTSDEGLTVDVVDVVNSMALDDGFVTALERLPGDPAAHDSVPPRTGLFVGRLLGNLETGLD